MHEMGIAMQIIEIAKNSIPKNLTHKKIEKIHLDIGKLSAIVPDSLSFCFEIAVQGTALDGAQLVINEIPVTLKCENCQSTYTVDTPDFKCKHCNSNSLTIIAGREMDIKTLEIED